MNNTRSEAEQTNDNVWWAVPALIAILAGAIAFLGRADAAQTAAWCVYFAGWIAIVPVAARSLLKGLHRQLFRIPGLLIALLIMGAYLYVFHRDGIPFGH
ncbi:hypothetical protein [Streptomyces sp. NPDC001621]|uniref:hypothetical protein n=1 Tax=Streptomyces sp. NPDC001621 TaxID=3364594 RepID=UPI0036A261B8